MERTTVLFLLLFCALSLTGQNFQQQADELLEGAFAKDDCAGLAAGFAVDGAISWAEGTGFSNLENESPFHTETLHRIGAVSKLMTAVAIMQLYEQDLINLDATVQCYLPDYPEHVQGDITVRHLLTHSSGIIDQVTTRGKAHTESTDLIDATALFQAKPLLFQPGSDFRYSAYGFVVLGRIVEEVAGMPYGDYLRAHVWEPAGMTHTEVAFYAEGNPDKASLYRYLSNGEIRPVYATQVSNRLPGIEVYSTTTDLLHFGDAIMNGTLLQPATTDLMMQDAGLKTDGYGCAMGWYRYHEHPHYGAVVGINDSQSGCSAMFMLLPEQKATVVVLSNTSGVMPTVSYTGMKLVGLAGVSANQ